MSSNQASPYNPTNAIKDLVKETLYNSVAQAIIKICLTPNLILKLFLALSVLFTTSLSFYLITQSIIIYLKFEVNSLSRTLFEIPSVFPKVTICNIHPFTSKASLDFIKEWNKGNEALFNLLFNDDYKITNMSYKQRNQLIKKISAYSLSKMNQITNETILKQFGHSIRDILLDCKFDNSPCSYEDFKWEFKKMKGNCFSFNSNVSNLKKSKLSGSVFGLQLDLYAGFYENLTVLNSNMGIKIKIENSSYLSEDFDSIEISPGVQVGLRVERHFKTSIPKPYSNCDVDNTSPREFESELYNLIWRSPYQYSRQLCFVQCLQKRIIQECNCSLPVAISLFHAEPCLLNNDCSLNLIKNWTLTQNGYCNNLCPLECNQSSLHVSFSSILTLNEDFSDLIKSNKILASDFVKKDINSETVRPSIIRLFVFYDSLIYSISDETPKFDLIALFSNLGGILSLFLGVSLFSFIEIIQVLIEICFISKKPE